MPVVVPMMVIMPVVVIIPVRVVKRVVIPWVVSVVRAIGHLIVRARIIRVIIGAVGEWETTKTAIIAAKGREKLRLGR